jgi:hypothetical protein
MRPIRRNPDRAEAHRPVADPADSLLLALGDTLDDVERTRISNDNRLRSLVGEHEFSGKGVPDTDLAAVRLGEVVDALGEIERSVVRDLEKAMKAHRSASGSSASADSGSSRWLACWPRSATR